MKKNEKLLRRLLAEYMGLVYCTFNINNHKAEIVSKKFGFIQWLVENDKIDLEKLDIYYFCKNPRWSGMDLLECDEIEGYEKLIMALSISDDPIEFLISILK